MGFLDRPEVTDQAAAVLSGIFAAERESGVRLTPVSREIAALFVLAPTFDGPGSADGRIADDPEGAKVTADLIGELPTLLTKARSELGLSQRSPDNRDILSAGDLYHWLTEQAREDLAVRWPYSKD